MQFLSPLIERALAEDIGSGDITSELLIPEDPVATLNFVAREELVVCGAGVPELVYSSLRAKGEAIQSGSPRFARDDIAVQTLLAEGYLANPGDVIASATGNARLLLTGERVALNIMQRMSGVATLTKRYVDAVAGTNAKILDTRKTMPGLRLLDKYAVTVGGGVNHRMGLWDAVLVKDNHVGIGVWGLGIGDGGLGIRERIEKIRSNLTSLNPNPQSPIPVIVECDTLAQLREVLPTKPDRIMLDNMSLLELKEAVKITAGQVPLEASGGVNLDTVRAIAETGVDYISVGAITHSAPAVDIGADISPS